MLAATHLLELLGEAAAHVSPEMQKKYPAIPWPKIVSMRNRLIHGYDYIDYNIVWDAVTRNLGMRGGTRQGLGVSAVAVV